MDEWAARVAETLLLLGDLPDEDRAEVEETWAVTLQFLREGKPADWPMLVGAELAFLDDWRRRLHFELTQRADERAQLLEIED